MIKILMLAWFSAIVKHHLNRKLKSGCIWVNKIYNYIFPLPRNKKPTTHVRTVKQDTKYIITMVEKAVGRSWKSDMNILIWSTCRGRSKNDTVFFFVFNTHSVKAPCLVFLSKLWHFQKRKKKRIKKKMQTSFSSLWANHVCECTKIFFSHDIYCKIYINTFTRNVSVKFTTSCIHTQSNTGQPCFSFRLHCQLFFCASCFEIRSTRWITMITLYHNNNKKEIKYLVTLALYSQQMMELFVNKIHLLDCLLAL